MKMKGDKFENFIKKSVDSYNGEPSNAVWERMSLGLDDIPKLPFYKTTSFWKYFSSFVLLSSVIVFSVKSYKVISILKEENEMIKLENLSLKNEFDLFESKSLENLNIYKNSLDQNKLEVVDIQNRAELIELNLKNELKTERRKKDELILMNKQLNKSLVKAKNTLDHDSAISKLNEHTTKEKIEIDKKEISLLSINENSIIDALKIKSNENVGNDLERPQVHDDLPKIVKNDIGRNKIEEKQHVKLLGINTIDSSEKQSDLSNSDFGIYENDHLVDSLSKNINSIDSIGLSSNIEMEIKELSDTNSGAKKKLWSNRKDRIENELVKIDSLEKLRFLKQHIDEIEDNRIDPNIGWNYGIGAAVYNTYTEKEFNLDIGLSVNVDLEYNFNQYFGINVGIAYWYQKYIISNPTDEISNSYPMDNSEKQLTNIKVVNNILSVPLGLRLSLPLNRKGGLFGYASFSYLLHLPQNFNYEYGDGSQSTYNSNRYFIYAGTIDSYLGYERLTKKIIYQMGVFHSSNVIPIGLENTSIDMIGLKMVIKFRK